MAQKSSGHSRVKGLQDLFVFRIHPHFLQQSSLLVVLALLSFLAGRVCHVIIILSIFPLPPPFVCSLVSFLRSKPCLPLTPLSDTGAHRKTS